ncbi:hypothetical protein H9X57_10340 [Flavobacterium piscinae]|nr:hypothetical protein [Flavobacterium piscinae]MBC8883621.1 hypothetical protein [Flavobacterium piscinae]
MLKKLLLMVLFVGSTVMAQDGVVKSVEEVAKKLKTLLQQKDGLKKETLIFWPINQLFLIG